MRTWAAWMTLSFSYFPHVIIQVQVSSIYIRFSVIDGDSLLWGISRRTQNSFSLLSRLLWGLSGRSSEKKALLLKDFDLLILAFFFNTCPVHLPTGRSPSPDSWGWYRDSTTHLPTLLLLLSCVLKSDSEGTSASIGKCIVCWYSMYYGNCLVEPCLVARYPIRIVSTLSCCPSILFCLVLVARKWEANHMKLLRSFSFFLCLTMTIGANCNLIKKYAARRTHLV